MKQYGADGVRCGMLFSSPAGNDLPFDEGLCEQGRNFSNKIWNALRLVKGWAPEEKGQPESAAVAVKWMDHRLAQVTAEVNDHYSKFRISDVLMTCYKFAWNDFCSWYLEAVKPAYGENMDTATNAAVLGHFETLLKLLHPLMPFITEEMWHLLAERSAPGEALTVAPWPTAVKYDAEAIRGFAKATEIVSHVRNVRSENGIPFKEPVELCVRGDQETDTAFYPVIRKLANVSNCHRNAEMPERAFTFVISGAEYAIPIGDNIDTGEQAEKLIADLEYTRKFLKSVQKKLGNERFVSNAPEQVVATEKKKQADAEAKIALIEEKLNAMGATF
jgi:valyl-tRNA synthetase